MLLHLDGSIVEHRDVRYLRAVRRQLARGDRLDLVLDSSGNPDAVSRIRSLLQVAGFLVERVDGAHPDRTHIFARSVPGPPETLAAAAWGTDQPGTVLDLRYAPDETEWLDPQPHDVWSQAVASTAFGGAELVSQYPVGDPFGGARAAGTLSRFFGCALQPEQITFGAGVTSLLHDLCNLSDGGPIGCPSLVHADLEARAFSRGISIRTLPEPTAHDDLLHAVLADPPALLHLDRPTFTGHVMDLAAVSAVADAVASAGTIVLVDEAGATYLPPAASAARLVNGATNLVVLRGFTKAYSWGGLRAGYAVASREISSVVRALVAPMQVGEVALAAALRLLDAGDCLARLRPHIRSMRANAAALLASCGLELVPGHPDLPWIAIADRERSASALFDTCGIRPLGPVSHPCLDPVPSIVRITVPLSHDRFERLRTLLAAARQTEAS